MKDFSFTITIETNVSTATQESVYNALQELISKNELYLESLIQEHSPFE